MTRATSLLLLSWRATRPAPIQCFQYAAEIWPTIPEKAEAGSGFVQLDQVEARGQHRLAGTKAFAYHVRHSIARRKDLLASASDPIELLVRYVDSYLPNERETLRAWRVWAEFWAISIRDVERQGAIDILDIDWRCHVADHSPGSS